MSIRDSFFLLNVMNQYTMRHQKIPEAEGLLRIMLFSKDIRLLRWDVNPMELDNLTVKEIAGVEPRFQKICDCAPRLEEDGSLDTERRRLAHRLRTFRRRGVVPVYISTVWFITSLAFSINSAFGFQLRL